MVSRAADLSSPPAAERATAWHLTSVLAAEYGRGGPHIFREVVRMTSRLVFRGFAVFGALIFVAVLAVTAGAQPAPVRVVQGSDGTLYVLQGSSSWTLVPDQISDADVAALAPIGEIDGSLPSDVLTAQAPDASPAAA